MADNRLIRMGWIAVGLAVLGSLVALADEALKYRRTGVVDWGHVALAFGVPIILYTMVRTASAKQR